MISYRPVGINEIIDTTLIIEEQEGLDKDYHDRYISSFQRVNSAPIF